MKYTKIPEDTFKTIQLNAGILVDDFKPMTGEVGNLIGATSGGVSFSDSIEYSDFGEDIDNCPKNTMELKKLMSHEVKMSGTFITITPEMAALLAGAADVEPGREVTHIVPRNDLLMKDFKTIWWVGDYSDNNIGATAGFIAIKMFNTLNTGGFQIQSSDKAKGQFAFDFTGHYSMNAQEVVPYEIYVKANDDISYLVTQNLTNVTSSYTETRAIEGQPLSITLTPDDGYTFANVSVEMGGTDITSSVYDGNGNIEINEVTGDIIIFANAE